MTRKQFLSGALGTLAGAAFAQTGRRPKNVLLLMSDQHKPHAMGIDGDPVAQTKLYADELGRRNSGSGLPQIDDLWLDAGDPWGGEREQDDRQGPVAVGRASKMAEQDQFESFVARESVRFLKNHGQQPFFL